MEHRTLINVEHQLQLILIVIKHQLLNVLNKDLRDFKVILILNVSNHFKLLNIQMINKYETFYQNK
jgi:hypothetical protein